MNDTFEYKIWERCNDIYKQLGSSHNECVYQKALVLELYNLGASSVEYEKAVPVFYTDSNRITHTVGSERIDVLARFHNKIVLFELKAITSCIKDAEVLQIFKYFDALKHLNIDVTHMCIINFAQNLKKPLMIDSKFFNVINDNDGEEVSFKFTPCEFSS